MHACLQGVGKSRARSGKIESPGALAAEFVLHQTGGGRKKHVWSNGGDDDDFNLRRLDAALLEQNFAGLHGQVAGGHSLFYDVTGTNAGALHNPLVGGLDHFFQVLIGEQAWRNVSAEGGDLGAKNFGQSKAPSFCRVVSKPGFPALNGPTAKHRGTRCARECPLPLLPSGPGGICGIASRGTRCLTFYFIIGNFFRFCIRFH